MKKIALIIIMCFLFIDKVNASDELNIKAKSAIVIEEDTLTVLYEKDADLALSPASMTKMMSMLLTMEAIKSGKISLDDEVIISKKASSMGGSQIYLEEGSKAKVGDLLLSVALGSANDAAIALAEKVGGSVDNFVLMMNKKAKSIGANNTTFKNPHGLDEEGHLTTARDMALIASELLKYEDILKYTSLYETTIKHANGKSIWLVNTNNLIRFYEGIDGLKTGYTDNALYCLTATMKRNNMRIISVVMKEETKEDRTSDTINLMEYAFSNYYKETLIKKDKQLGEVFISNASNRKVPYYLEKDVSIILDKSERNIKYNYDIEIDNKKAPITKGERIGVLKLSSADKVYEYKIITLNDVKKANFFKRVYNNFIDITSGNLNAFFG